MADRAEIRPATRADVLEAFRNLYGQEKDPPVRIMGFTGRVCDRVIGVGGVAFYPNGARVMFCDISDDGRRFPVSLYRAAKMVLERAKQMRVPCVVVVDGPDVHPKTPNLLRHLGFRRWEDGMNTGWVWTKKET